MDPHYTFGVYSSGAYQPAINTEYVQASGYPVGNPWLGNNGVSNWLSHAPGQGTFVGYYHVVTDFDLTGSQEGFRAEFTQLSGSLAASVPEPASAVLLALGLPLLARRGRPSRRG